MIKIFLAFLTVFFYYGAFAQERPNRPTRTSKEPGSMQSQDLLSRNANKDNHDEVAKIQDYLIITYGNPMLYREISF